MTYEQALGMASGSDAEGGTGARRILLVEDDDALRGLFASVLRSRAYIVEEASTGDEAVAAFDRQCPDLLLSDLVLPGPNGQELASLCRARCPDTILVFMSGYTAEELQLIVQERGERGALRFDASRMLQELFEFGDLTAGQVMVPRVRVVGIPVGLQPDGIRVLLRETPHTRYPVYEKDLDHVLGMAHIKDLLKLLLPAFQLPTATHSASLPLHFL
jgi:CheY-like chemotaxis protein